MPYYMDVHEIPGITPEALADAHAADLSLQGKYGVEYLKYWCNEHCGKVFCLVSAPDPEAADRVHRESHGFAAARIIEVDPAIAEGFLGGGEIDPHGAARLPGKHGPGAHDTAVRTVLFTDIVNSTAITQRLGDDAGMKLLEKHDQLVRRAIKEFSGREIKHTGDGLMASFASAASAVRCGLLIQKEAAAMDEAGLPLEVRIGAAAGEPVEHHHDLFGATVQLAARLCSAAEPRQVLVSVAVMELCLGKGLCFADGLHFQLKGFERPITAYVVLVS